MSATRVGRLNSLLDLQQPVAAETASGAATLTYATVARAWGLVEMLSGSEATAARQLEATATHKITIQRIPDLTIGPDWQAVDRDGRIFRFLSTGDRTGENREIEMIAVETVEATSTI